MALDRKRRSSAALFLHEENPSSDDEDSDNFESAAAALLKLGSVDLGSRRRNDREQTSRKGRKRRKHHNDGADRSSSSFSSSSHHKGFDGEVLVINFLERPVLAPFGAVPRRRPTAVSDDEEEEWDGEKHRAAKFALMGNDYNVNRKEALNSRLAIVRDAQQDSSLFFLSSHFSCLASRPLAPPPRLARALPVQSRIAQVNGQDDVIKSQGSSSDKAL